MQAHGRRPVALVMVRTDPHLHYTIPHSLLSMFGIQELAVMESASSQSERCLLNKSVRGLRRTSKGQQLMRRWNCSVVYNRLPARPL